MRIKPAEQQMAVINMGGYRQWLSHIIAERWQHNIDWDNIATDAPKIVAHINRGDWVAKCDLMQDTSNPCGGSVIVTYNDKVFYCDECLNVAYNYKPRMVKFPSEKERLIVEELLTARPHPNLRHYKPHEGDTVAIVQQENKEQPWLKI